MHHFSLIGKPYKCEFTCMTDKLNKINISLVFHFIKKTIRTDFPRILFIIRLLRSMQEFYCFT